MKGKHREIQSSYQAPPIQAVAGNSGHISQGNTGKTQSTHQVPSNQDTLVNISHTG